VCVCVCVYVCVCVCVCVECVWLVAGVKQPHLARVGLIGVGLHTCGA